MDRDTILSSFQEISQIQNFDECIQILESVNWDLQSAVDSMDQVISTPRSEIRMPHDFMTYSPIIERTSLRNRELTFNVDIKGNNIVVNILENKTVADLARLIANEINEPNTRLKINGLKNPYNDYTVLQSMKLPLVSDVVANVIESNNSVKVGPSSTQIPQKAYNLSIQIFINDEYSQTLPLTFSGRDSIGKVKRDLATLTGTNITNQLWFGWPNSDYNSELTLNESGVPEDGTLTVHINIDVKSSRRNEEFKTPSMEFSLNNSREIFDNDDDDYPDDDFTDDIELAVTETEISKKRSAALMSVDAYLDPVSAVIHFSTEFAARYCASKQCQFTGTSTPESSSVLPSLMTPPFFLGSIDDAISSTLNLPPHEKDQYPVIVILSKSQGVVEILEIIDGMRTKEETVAHLWDIKSKFEDKQLPDRQAWDERQLRDLVKQEQDAAYQESLLLDQQKEQWKNDEDQRVKDEETKANREKEKINNERENRIAKAIKTLPVEPCADGPDTVTILLRAPANMSVHESTAGALKRRFLYSHTLLHLIAYMESVGFLRTEFKLLTAYPRKNLTELGDLNVTLKQLGITKRETLTLERM